MIDEGVLSDAREIDNFVRKYGPGGIPSLESTLRIVRDVHPDTFRTIAKDVWGVGGSGGADLVGSSFDGTIEQLDNAINQAASWTGQAKNAYGDRMEQIKTAINDVRKPSQDVGKALEGIADAYDFGWTDMFNNILTIMGLVIAAIGAIAAVIIGIVAGWTGFGAVVSLVIAIISLIIAAAAVWWSLQVQADEKIKSLEAAAVAASTTVESTGRATP